MCSPAKKSRPAGARIAACALPAWPGLHSAQLPPAKGSFVHLTSWPTEVTSCALDDEACTDTILQALWKLVPNAQEVTSVGQLVRWTNDPFAGGSWALWGPGQAGSAHAAIRAPAGRLFFAGEHTAEAYRGMEAAMESGERAALEIMRALA